MGVDWWDWPFDYIIFLSSDSDFVEQKSDKLTWKIWKWEQLKQKSEAADLDEEPPRAEAP